MAVTVNLYNHTSKKFGEGSFADTDIYKVALLNTSGTFTATHTAWSDLSAFEVSGNGWTAGGETLTAVDVTTVTTNDAKFDAANVTATASGGAIGPTSFGVIVNTSETPDALVAHINFDGAKTADSGTDFKITWNTNGIFTWTVT